jgi:hypothetical protein
VSWRIAVIFIFHFQEVPKFNLRPADCVQHYL